MVVQRSAVVQRAGARSAYALPAQTAKAPRLDLRASIDPPAAGWGGGSDSAHTPESACARLPL